MAPALEDVVVVSPTPSPEVPNDNKNGKTSRGHSKDRPEDFDGTRTSYKRWRADTPVGREHKLPSPKRGMRTLRRLGGAAWGLIEEIDWEQFRGCGRFTKLMQLPRQ